MAVNDSTATSVCLYCKTSKSVNEIEFHEIYDEVGLELQLPSLVEEFLHIKPQNKKGHCLCDECLNRLIELYDLSEHSKRLKDGTPTVNTIKKECSNVKEQLSENENTHPAIQVEQDISLAVEGKDKFNPEIEDQHENETEKTSKLANKKVAFIYQSTNSSIVEVTPRIKSVKPSSNDLINSILEENTAYNSEIEQTSHQATIAGTEIPSEEFDIIEESPNDQESEENIILNSHLQEVQNDYEEQSVIEDNSTKTSDNDFYTEEDFVLEEDEELDAGNQIRERFQLIHANDQASESKSYEEPNESIMEIDVSNVYTEANADDADVEKDVDGKSDKYCVEEEYLIEGN